MLWQALSIDEDDVVEDGRRFASCSPMRSTHRAPDGCIDGCVKYPDACVEDYSLSNGTVVAVPQCFSSHAKQSWHDLQFFPGNLKNNWNRCRKVRLSVQFGTAKSDALRGCQGDT